jgi:hypothetical protein
VVEIRHYHQFLDLLGDGGHSPLPDITGDVHVDGEMVIQTDSFSDVGS